MVNIYILELNGNKYYIGKTNNIHFRLESHFNNNGSEWTKKYPPKKIIKILHNCDDFDEDKYTKQYMLLKGMNNVRGGSYTKIKLNDEEIKLLKKELSSASDKCYICGSNEHFANNCDNDNDYDNIFNKLSDKLEKLLIEQDRCFRCHRLGHYVSECYAKVTIHGDIICDDCDSDENEYIEIWECRYCDKEFTTEKGLDLHENRYCKKKYSSNYSSNYSNSDNYSNSSNCCYRCGRKNHFANECFSKFHVNGYKI